MRLLRDVVIAAFLCKQLLGIPKAKQCVPDGVDAAALQTSLKRYLLRVALSADHVDAAFTSLRNAWRDWQAQAPTTPPRRCSPASRARARLRRSAAHRYLPVMAVVLRDLVLHTRAFPTAANQELRRGILHPTGLLYMHATFFVAAAHAPSLAKTAAKNTKHCVRFLRQSVDQSLHLLRAAASTSPP
jgi:hypothetical protein